MTPPRLRLPEICALLLLTCALARANAQEFDPLAAAQAEALFKGNWSHSGPETFGASHYRRRAQKLEAEGKDFSQIFLGLNRLLLERTRSSWMAHRLEALSLVSGMVRWTEGGGKPAFQGREDLALHFIYGGFLAVHYGKTIADRVAFEKEKKDSRQPDNYFDLDDMGATMLGVRWISSLGLRRKDHLRWMETWASGKRTLAALPALKFGRLASGKLPKSVQVAQVQRFADKAMKGSATEASADSFLRGASLPLPEARLQLESWREQAESLSGSQWMGGSKL